MTALKGDFIGFQLGRVHSSELGIMRVSDGSRYSEDLLPNFQDKTEQVAGGNGTYFWNRQYTHKSITVPFAFDGLTEKQIWTIKFLGGSIELGEIGAEGVNDSYIPLWYDETPYKAYLVKLAEPPQIKYVAFTEQEEDNNGIKKDVRIYKGEGTFQFIAYDPFAHCSNAYTGKYLNEYEEEDFPTKGEWAESSRLLEEKGVIDVFGAQSATLYNAGDMSTDLKIIIDMRLGIPTSVNLNGKILNFPGLVKQKVSQEIFDGYISINSKTNLIEGCNRKGEPTGNLYNKYITSGDFFKIPSSIIGREPQILSITGAGAIITDVDYDYLYF